MKMIRLSIALLMMLFSFAAYAGQDVVKTMPLNEAITQSGIVRLIVRLTDDATGPDIGLTLHEAETAAPWDDGMAIMMFDLDKNTNGGIHLAGYDGGTWMWQENVKEVEKGRDIVLWITVDAANNTHGLSAQMQGESNVTTLYADYGDRASLKGKANSSAAFCSVFVNNRDGQQRSAIQIVQEAEVVSAIEPYVFSDTTCFPTSSPIIPVTIKEGESYSFDGQELSNAGVYYDTLMNVQGCDSIVTINLSVTPSSEKAVILSYLQRVNNYYMAQNPETETVNSGKAKWLEGSYFNGHTALFQLHPTRENMRYAMQWGENNDWNIGDTRGEADNQCVGQVYMDMYYANGAKDDAMLAKVGTSVENMVNRSSAISDWDWIDALYMAMPTLTRYGNLTGKQSYFDKLYAMYNSTKVTQRLYNANDSLWYRDGAVLSGKKHTCYWARGNGWVFGAHVRTLMYLPEDDAHRQEYIDTYKAMAKKLKSVQRPDGFWNATLDDDTYYPGMETSGTAFYVYGMAWGINNGFLDTATYLPTVLKGWNALVDHALDSNGRIGYVQGVADEPKDDQPVTFAKSREYGEGNFLLAGTEVIKLVEGEMPIPEGFFVKAAAMKNASTLQVEFFEPAEKTSAETVANYHINKEVQIQSATLSHDGLTCDLVVSNTKKGGYAISFTDIKSVSNKTIEDISGQFFMVNEEQSTSLVQQSNSELELNVYPCPANDVITIASQAINSGEVAISLWSVSGQKMISKVMTIQQSLNCTLDVNELSAGMYLLKVATANACVNKSVLID